MNSNDVQQYLVEVAGEKDEAVFQRFCATTQQESEAAEKAYKRACSCEETLIETGRLF